MNWLEKVWSWVQRRYDTKLLHALELRSEGSFWPRFPVLPILMVPWQLIAAFLTLVTASEIWSAWSFLATLAHVLFYAIVSILFAGFYLAMKDQDILYARDTLQTPVRRAMRIQELRKILGLAERNSSDD